MDKFGGPKNVWNTEGDRFSETCIKFGLAIDLVFCTEFENNLYFVLRMRGEGTIPGLEVSHSSKWKFYHSTH